MSNDKVYPPSAAPEATGPKCQMPKLKTLLITKTREDESTKEEIDSKEVRDCYGAESFEREGAHAFYSARLISKDQWDQDTPPVLPVLRKNRSVFSWKSLLDRLRFRRG